MCTATAMCRRRHPAVLLILGLVGSVGCVYQPAFDHPRTPAGRDPRKLIGPASSGRAVATGRATSDAVRAILGEADLTANGGRAVAYAYSWPTGRWVGLFAGERWGRLALVTDPPRQRRFLFLRFGRDGTLEHFEWIKPREANRPMVSSEEWAEFVRRTASSP